MNNKEIKSDWWFFANTTLASIGICFIFSLFVLLAGLLFTITLPKNAVVIIVVLLWAISVFSSVKVVSMNASIEQKSLIKIFVYNLLLYLVLMLRMVPFIVTFINANIAGLMQNIVIPIIFAIMISGFITLLIYNSLEKEV